MRTPEGQVKAALKKWLKQNGAYAFWPVQTGRGSRTVDCLACVGGNFIAIEVKARGKKPTKLQERILWDVRRAGGEASIATFNAAGQLELTHKEAQEAAEKAYGLAIATALKELAP